MTTTATIALDELLAAARGLALAARWEQATGLLDAAAARLPQSAAGRCAGARLALAAAEIAVDSAWYNGNDEGAARLSKVDAAALDPERSWDLGFARLRYEYRGRLGHPDPALRERAERFVATAPDVNRRGWAHMYLGLIYDNVLGDRAAAAPHYEQALTDSAAPPASTGAAALPSPADSASPPASTDSAAPPASVPVAGDDLLRREAQRHLGDHARDAGDHAGALHRWREATALGARAGMAAGTLSQQILLAVLARDAGDEPGAVALATEVLRWSEAIGATVIATRTADFLRGAAIA